VGCAETPVYHKVPQDELNLLITFYLYESVVNTSLGYTPGFLSDLYPLFLSAFAIVNTLSYSWRKERKMPLKRNFPLFV